MSTLAAHPTEVFVAYDFHIRGGLPDNIMALSKKPPAGFSVKWTGAPEGRSQGDLWKHVVAPGIHAAHRVVAYVDLPNANVGFEIGYALGQGKLVAIARCRDTKPLWLDYPPLNGSLCEQAQTIEKLRALVTDKPDDWNHAAAPARTGVDVLFLCPRVCGSAYVELKPQSWRMVPKDGWGVDDLQDRLGQVGLVVWVVAPHHEGDSGRDGAENAALSVVAGYAAAIEGIQLHVLIHEDARSVADVVARRRSFRNLDELEAILNEIELSHVSQHTDQHPTKEATAAISEQPIQSETMLRLLYAETVPSRRPFAELRLEKIKWDLVLQYADKERIIDPQARDQRELLADLYLFSMLAQPPMLHRAAVLCFHVAPHLLVDCAVSKFVVGSSTNPEDIRTVTGSLSEQIKTLTDLARDRLRTIVSFKEGGPRSETLEIPLEVVRELISNAVAHRDYDASGNVQVRLTKLHFEVESPGVFPYNLSWESLISSSAEHSQPRDPAVTRYLNALLSFEGIGRGFAVIRQHLTVFGPDSITCQVEHGAKTLIRVKRPSISDDDARRRDGRGFLESAPICVFISALKSEMGRYRRELTRALQRRGFEALVVEDFSASPAMLLEQVRNRIEESDAVILLVGERCGPLPADENAVALGTIPEFDKYRAATNQPRAHTPNGSTFSPNTFARKLSSSSPILRAGLFPMKPMRKVTNSAPASMLIVPGSTRVRRTSQ